MSSFDEKILNAVNDIAETTNNPFKGKWVSILGDSISTYNNYIPSGNANYYPNSDVDDVSKTWWHILLTKLGAKLCVNNSYGGRCVVSQNNDADAIYGAAWLHRVKGNTYINLDGSIELATEDIKPDIILVHLGMNDFNNSVKLGEMKTGCNSSKPTETDFYNYYNYLLLNIVGLNYYSAQVYCLDMTFCNSFGFLASNGAGTPQPEYQKAISEEARIFGIKCLHVSKIGIHGANCDSMLVDKIHPKAEMMKMIANQCYSEMMADNCL